MKYQSIFSFLISLYGCILISSAAAQNYIVSRTEHDHPDLNGVWNFNDSTPFERPDRFGMREYLNAEEIAARNTSIKNGQQRRDSSEANMSERILNVPTNDTGAYNLFWSFYDEPYPNIRSSLIVYPPDGKIPATINSVTTQHSPPGSNPCNLSLIHN